MDKKDIQSLVYISIIAILVTALVLFMNYHGIKPGKVSDTPKIQVYVKGEVKNPGVYEMDADERVIDAINAAGGVTSEGDKSHLDLARFLEDGETISVPKPYNPANEVVSIDKININTATVADLDKLDGVGEGLAERIIEYRTENGFFNDVHELLKVPGIGKSKLDVIVDKISVE